MGQVVIFPSTKAVITSEQEPVQGFTQVPHAIQERLTSIRLSGREGALIDVIIRKTYGFQKTSDAISGSQFEKFTGVRRNHSHTLLGELERRKLIRVSRAGITNRYSVNPQVSEWLDKAKKLRNGSERPATYVDSPDLGTSPATGSQLVPIAGHTKETLTKQTSNNNKYIPAGDGFVERAVTVPRGMIPSKAVLEDLEGSIDWEVVDLIGAIERFENYHELNETLAQPWQWQILLKGWIQQAYRLRIDRLRGF